MAASFLVSNLPSDLLQRAQSNFSTMPARENTSSSPNDQPKRTR